MYISTREMVISIICNACGMLGFILWAIEAHRFNANQRIQSVENVKNVEADTPQTEKPKIRKRNDKPFRAVWLDNDHNEIGTPQTEREGDR